MKIKNFFTVILTLCIISMSFSSLAIVNAQDTNDQNSVQTVVESSTIESDQNELVINDADGFSEFVKSPNNWKKITLACDIDVKGREFKSIGEFNGIFDGCGHTIKNFIVKAKPFYHESSHGDFYFNVAFIEKLGNKTNSAEFKNVMFDNYVIDISEEWGKFKDVSFYISGLVFKNYGHISGVNIKNGSFIFHEANHDYRLTIAGFVYCNEKEGTIENSSIDMKSRMRIHTGFVCKNYGKIINSNAIWPRTKSSDVSIGFVELNCYTGIIEGCSSMGYLRHIGFVEHNSKGTISNCTATGKITPSNENVHFYGIAGFVGRNTLGTIKNCSTNMNINGEGNIRGFIGANYGGTIIYCEAIGILTSIDDEVKGFVGRNESGTFEYYEYDDYNKEYKSIKAYGTANIEKCRYVGEVKSEFSAAGFAGYNGGKIVESSVSGNVTGKKITSGFVRKNGYGSDEQYHNGYIKGCKTTGNVTGKECVGGFAGKNEYYSEIIDCDSEVNVTGEECVGGFVGMNMSCGGNITNCTATGNVTAKSSNKTMKCGGFVGVNSCNIENCTAKGKTIAINKSSGKIKVKAKAIAGGFVGENTDDGGINSCEATGGAEARSSLGEAIAGGFVGISGGRCKSSITNSKSSGYVYLSAGIFYKDDSCGGFAGMSSDGSFIENCYAKCKLETTFGKKGGGFIGNLGANSIIKNCSCESVRMKKGKTISSLNEIKEKSFYYVKSNKAKIF